MDRPPVESHTPPPVIRQVVNPILTMVLRSPFHRLLSKKLALLTVTGRRTGRQYTVPIGRHEDDGVLLVSVSGSWRYNLETPVRLTIDGHEHDGHPEVETDPDQVAEIFRMLYEREGPSSASLLGLKVNVGRALTAHDIRPAVADRWVARIRLTHGE
jgi:F420H(2)-dependent quinone reductase